MSAKNKHDVPEASQIPQTSTSSVPAEELSDFHAMYCQKCRTPLKLDGSLESLNPAAFELLISKLAQLRPAELQDEFN